MYLCVFFNIFSLPFSLSCGKLMVFTLFKVGRVYFYTSFCKGFIFFYLCLRLDIFYWILKFIHIQCVLNFIILYFFNCRPCIAFFWRLCLSVEIFYFFFFLKREHVCICEHGVGGAEGEKEGESLSSIGMLWLPNPGACCVRFGDLDFKK